MVMIETSLEGPIEQLVYETEKHFHNYEQWIGLNGSPSGEVTRADILNNTPSPFQLDAGNDTYGAWVQILGSGDTPIITGMNKYDLHELIVVDHEHNNTFYNVQIAIGESADLAGLLTAKTVTNVPFVTPSAPGGQNEPVEFRDRRGTAGQKVWARCWARGQNTGTLDLYFGLHEYLR